MNTKFEEIKNTELFPGKKFSDLIAVIFENSQEIREESLSAYREFKSMIKGDDDLFLNGDKPDKYLAIAQKTSDDLTKVLSIIQKLLEEKKIGESNGNDAGFDSAQLIDMLEKQNIGPSRFVENKNAVAQKEKTTEEESDNKIIPFFKQQ